MGKNVHVTHRSDGKWQAKSEGSSRAYRVTSTQTEAIEYGRDLARNNRSELLTHGMDGTIRDKRSYGNDPYPPTAIAEHSSRSAGRKL